VEREVFFFEEELQEELVEAAEDVPVNVPDVVAADVLAVIGELDGMATLLGAAFALELAEEDAAGGEVERIEACDLLGRQEVFESGGAGDGTGSEHRVFKTKHSPRRTRRTRRKAVGKERIASS
jgi:hypothetical protein